MTNILKILKNGGAGVLLTDTLYGLVGLALKEETVERIYQIKNRNDKKPLIILISSINDLKLFGIEIDPQQKKILETFWPGEVSIVLPCLKRELKYLHKGTETLAFRLPKKKYLLNILKKVGPLVAPSANPEGLPPAPNITVAKKYFGNKVDFYLRGGKPKNKPSTLIKIDNDGVVVLRK